MQKEQSINSPFRYAGGKFYARKLILEHIPSHNYYIEPFSGGASIFFAKSKVYQNHLNDLDEELINVLRVIRDNPDDLIYFLKKKSFEESNIKPDLVKGIKYYDPLPATKQLHNYFKNEFIPHNSLDKAGRWFYLNRTSYSGIMNYQNMYWGYGDKYSMQPKNWASNIRKTSKKLQDVKLSNFDFEKIIDEAPDNAFLFIDPPYFNADQDKFYNCIFRKEDHYRLEKCLKRNQNRLLMFVTYDNCEKIRELYNWMEEIHDKEWNYCIQRTDDQKFKTKRKGNRYKGQEIFILNYSSKRFFIDESVQIEMEFI